MIRINEKYDFHATSLYKGCKFRTEEDSQIYVVKDITKTSKYVVIDAIDNYGNIVPMNFDSQDMVELVH